MTVATIEALEQARREGYAQGRQDEREASAQGHRDEIDQARQDGYVQGHGDGRDEVLQALRSAAGTCRGMFDLGAEVMVLCDVRGVKLAYGLYSAMPARTVRRICAEGSALGTDKGERKKTLKEVITCTLGTIDLETITTKAKAAGVSAWKALSAVTQYGNQVDRVAGVLTDLVSLVAAGGRVHSPDGMFVSLMRTGGDVILPERVLVAREDVETRRQAEEAARVKQELLLAQQRADEETAHQQLSETLAEDTWEASRAALRFIVGKALSAAGMVALEARVRAGQLSAAALVREATMAKAGMTLDAWVRALQL